MVLNEEVGFCFFAMVEIGLVVALFVDVLMDE